MKISLKRAGYLTGILWLQIYFYSCGRTGFIRTSVSHYNYRINEGPVDTVIYNKINPYKAELEAKMNEVIASSASEMVKGGLESTLGNFSADALLSTAISIAEKNGFTKPVAAILNNGGLRTSLPKGNIKVSDIFELMPFENELVLITIDGSKMLELLNFVAEKNEPISGIKLGIKDKKAFQPMVNGQPFDSRRNYCIATSDYLANSGDKMSFFNEPIEKIVTGLKIRDLLIDYLRTQHAKGIVIHPSKDERIYKADNY